MLSVLLMLLLSFLNPNAASLQPSITMKGCGITKSCLRWSSCEMASCEYAVSWKIVSFNNSDYVELELVAKLYDSREDEYVALGFSEDDKMSNDGVVGCYYFNNTVGVAVGFNAKYYNIIYNPSMYDSNLLVSSGSKDRYGVEYDATTGHIRCRFLRLLTPVQNADKLKTLSGGATYYFLNAIGPIHSLRSFGKHYYTTRRVSLVNYDVTSKAFSDKILSTQYRLVKLHSSLMIVGWLLLITNGIVLAKFYKDRLSQPLLGSQVWFQLHRIIQALGVCLVLSAFVIIFVHVGGYSHLGDLPNSAHPILGIIAVSLMIINPIIALFRCNPKSKQRPIFNWMHSLVGLLAWIFALSTMAIGIQLPPAGLTLSSLTYPWVLVLIVAVLLATLMLYGSIKSRISKIGDSDIQMLSTAENDPVVRASSVGLEIIVCSIICTVIFSVILIIFVNIF